MDGTGIRLLPGCYARTSWGFCCVSYFISNVPTRATIRGGRLLQTNHFPRNNAENGLAEPPRASACNSRGHSSGPPSTDESLISVSTVFANSSPKFDMAIPGKADLTDWPPTLSGHHLSRSRTRRRPCREPLSTVRPKRAKQKSGPKARRTEGMRQASILRKAHHQLTSHIWAAVWSACAPTSASRVRRTPARSPAYSRKLIQDPRHRQTTADRPCRHDRHAFGRDIIDDGQAFQHASLGRPIRRRSPRSTHGPLTFFGRCILLTLVEMSQPLHVV